MNKTFTGKTRNLRTLRLHGTGGNSVIDCHLYCFSLILIAGSVVIQRTEVCAAYFLLLEDSERISCIQRFPQELPLGQLLPSRLRWETLNTSHCGQTIVIGIERLTRIERGTCGRRKGRKNYATYVFSETGLSSFLICCSCRTNMTGNV